MSKFNVRRDTGCSHVDRQMNEGSGMAQYLAALRVLRITQDSHIGDLAFRVELLR